ncbi:MAG TPA: subtype B tannase [Fusobacterium sp.]|uniref:subtype B tannase n=1 Tax=Fusobacterium sp. TaxID=68766 RepID=UPI002F405F2A
MKHFIKYLLFPLILWNLAGKAVLAEDGSRTLVFDDSQYTKSFQKIDGKKIEFRSFENIIYIKNPVSIEYQHMNIYIPEAYFEGKQIGSYNEKTAPIFLPNMVEDYMSGKAGIPKIEKNGKANEILLALSKGYVVAAPAVRGRTLKNSEEEYIGKAPAAIVDLKAAVRYLHYNDERMPGDSNKIISNGTGAGGALAALLGASGNSKDYEKYLRELGAAPAHDNIFAVSSYSPTTNLEHADIAYEWLYADTDLQTKKDIPTLQKWFHKKQKSLSEEERKVAKELKAKFAGYFNSLELRDKEGKLLYLNYEGRGNFEDYLKHLIIDSAQKALHEGKKLSSYSWIDIKDKKVQDLDFQAYLHSEKRKKSSPVFDSFDLKNAENELFGNKEQKAQHFTEYSLKHSKKNGNMAKEEVIKGMNPMSYLEDEEVNIAKYWRIRHGSSDKDTSLVIPVILAIKLQNLGYNVDFFVPWEKQHEKNYDLKELFQWMDEIVKKDRR